MDSALAFLFLSLLQYQKAASRSGDTPTTNTIGITVRLRLPSLDASFGDAVVEEPEEEDEEDEGEEGAEPPALLPMTLKSW